MLLAGGALISFVACLPSADVATERLEAAIQAYCGYAEGVAASEAQLLQWPRLFATGGLVPGEPETAMPTGALNEKVRPRLTAGLAYDLFRLYEGAIVRGVGEAECSRYRAISKLVSFADHGDRLGVREALLAQVKVLETAGLELSAQVAEARKASERFELPIDEVHGLEGQEQRLQKTLFDLAVAAEAPPTAYLPVHAELVSALAAFRAAETELAAAEEDRRNVKAWQLELKGGVDRVFEDGRPTSVFGMASFAVSPGRLFQGSNEARALEGRLHWRDDGPDGLVVRVRTRIGALDEILEAEIGRRNRLANRIQELEQRIAKIAAVASPEVRRFKAALSFERIELMGQVAYLDSHIGSLKKFFGR